MSWTDRTPGLPANPVYALAHDGTRVYAGGGEGFLSQFLGLYSSTTGGASWTPVHDGTWPVLAVRDLTFDPNDGDVILVATEGSGVHRSIDGGASWQIAAGGTAGLTVNSVHFAPGNSTAIVLGVDSYAVLASTDGGASFDATATGINELNLVSIRGNPANPDEIAAAFQSLNSGGVYRTVDGGAAWANEPLPPTRFDTVRFGQDGALYAISTGPSTAGAEGVYRREPGGAWSHLGPDLGPFFESDLHALLFAPATPGLVFVGGSTLGSTAIWRSVDRGDHWDRVHDVAQRQITDFAAVTDGTDQVFVATYEALPGGVVRSDDGGLSWSDSTTGLPPDFQGRALCNGAAAETIFAGDGAFPPDGGVFRSVDGGQSWTRTGPFGESVRDLACDPQSGGRVIYAALDAYNGIRLAVSRDGGASFVTFEDGLNTLGASNDVATWSGPPSVVSFGCGQGGFVRPALGIFSDGFESGDVSAWSTAVP